ncbi:MAG: hypothetical protein JWM80_847 [Cyanobacteria bacterium RYN_339]|nr:hypothetical protein [Cyanobacteria bacterium RYN_339]
MRTTTACLLTCLLLAGCTPTPTGAGATGGSSVKNTAPVSTKQAIVCAMRGFTGTTPRFAATDAAKIQIQLQDELGKAVPTLKTVQPDTHGSFTISEVPAGSYFASASLPDKTTWIALVRTDHPNDNFLSSGSTLATAWAKQQLGSKLIFVEDLPYPDLLLAAIRLDAALTTKDQTLRDGDDARTAQMTELVAADANLKDQLAAIEKTLVTRAATNLEAPPPYASEAEYAAKKQKVQK